MRCFVLMPLAVVALLFLGIAPVAEATCAEIEPVDLLPADEVCPGWTRDGEPRTAHTIEELQEIINGGYELYVQYGFVAAAFQFYVGEIAGEPTLMDLSVFNQGTAENAAALYHDPDSGMGDPVEDWEGSGEARMRMAFGMVIFQFWEECFYVAIYALAGGEEAVPHVRCFAGTIVEQIQGATPETRETWGGIKAAFR